MALTTRMLINPKYAENAQTTQYIAGSTATIIDKFTATNNSAATATINVHLIQNGGVVGDNNLISARDIAAGEAYTFPEISGHILGNGGFISTLASAASALTILASGREIT